MSATRIPLDNARVAAIFEELADRLQLLGENPFKTRAYRTFAVALRALGEPLLDVHARGEHHRLEGVGRAIADKIDALIEHGTFDALERARAATPTGLLDVLRLPGLDNKTVQLLWQHARVTTPAELRAACDDGRVANVPGLGKKKQGKILAAARAIVSDAEPRALGDGQPPALVGDAEPRLLAVALEAAVLVGATLEAAGATQWRLVGEACRGVEVVSCVHVLCLGIAPPAIVAAITAADDDLLLRSIEAEEHDVHAVLQGRGALHVVAIEDAKSWALECLTRSADQAHVAWLEEHARDRGGLAEVGYDRASEEAIYETLGLAYVPPELREGALPIVPGDLLATVAVRGVFHVHTDWSDGISSILDMARSAARAGFEYVGISDHSQAASYANGLDAPRLREQADAVAAAREAIPEIRIFHGVEVDILPDGSLDLDDATLASLDFVIASVHARFNMSSEEMTARIVRAVSHPLVTILGHPTGRLLLGRAGYTFDIDAVAKAAVSNGTYLEINANAHRLDLSPPLVRRARLSGALFAINPDAHGGRGFEDVPLGVMVARRSGLVTESVLNTVGKDAMTTLLRERRARYEAARA